MVMKTIDFRALDAQAQEQLRRRAVHAVLGGMKRVEAARLFGVSRQAVWSWMRRYQQGGSQALKAGRRGRPRGGGRLLAWQAAQTARTVVDRFPNQLKLPFWLWTRHAVAQLIARRYGVKLSVWSVGRMLARWGFTPQKPVRRALEQNPEEVRRWLEEVYPRIRAAARRQKAEIYWADEMGVRSDHATGTSYGRKGKGALIPATGKRFGCNMLSALTNRGSMMFMVFRRRFNHQVLREFLRRFVRQTRRKTFLILDRHPVHVSRPVRRWFAAHQRSLCVFYLPGYSPELNPDEYLNQDVKANAVGRRRPRDQGELIAGLRSYLHSTQRRPAAVRNYFEAESVRYAAM
jgi:transposase